ncbi:MAG TPA: glycosyltransferase family 1 protein [bacterium]|nr:glycosyltransferase family 1 protein [bacterium]
MKKILIDGRFIGVGESMTRYILEFLNGIIALDQENQYTLLLRPQGEAELERYPKIVNAENLSVDVLDIPHYSFSEQTKLLSYLNAKEYDLIHFIQFNHPIRYKKPYVITIHDLILLHHFEGNLIKKLAFKMVMNSAVKNSKKILTISNATKDGLVKDLKADPGKIAVTYLGVDRRRYNKEAKYEIRNTKYEIGGPYLLYTGAWKKHKNLIGLLKAYEQFYSKQFETIGEHKNETMEQLGNRLPKLVLAGRVDPDEPEVAAEIDRINSALNTQYDIRNTIITTGFVAEEDLPSLCAGALAYVIPSLEEGFGMPPLEAMACGIPVAASNASCIPEVLGDAAIYFNPNSTDEIAETLAAVVSDEKLRTDLAKKGLKQAQKYSWSETAKGTLDVYKQALK